MYRAVFPSVSRLHPPSLSVSVVHLSVERGTRTGRHVFLHFVCDFFSLSLFSSLSAVPLIVFS